jgi:3-hydroxyisobutyrate dehydrogenase
MAMSVAVLGTGTMGLPMARNLAQAGLEVRAWNRTTERARPLVEHGVRVEEDAAVAAAGADAVLTMLGDADAVLEAAGRAELAEGQLWIESSTIGLDGTERAARLAQERGAVFVDAPVSGTKGPAEQGALVVLASGPEDALQRCAPVFDAIGSKVVHCGEAGGGTRLKLVVNHWVLVLIEGIAETIQVAEALGVDPRAWLQTIDGGPVGPAYAQMKGTAMLERQLDPQFRLALALKDARLVLDAAARHDVEAALVEVIAARMQRAIDRGHGDEDMAATYFGAP